MLAIFSKENRSTKIRIQGEGLQNAQLKATTSGAYKTKQAQLLDNDNNDKLAYNRADSFLPQFLFWGLAYQTDHIRQPDILKR